MLYVRYYRVKCILKPFFFFIIVSSLKFAYGHPNQMLMFYIVFAVSYYSL